MKYLINLLLIILLLGSCITRDNQDDPDSPEVIGDPAEVGMMIESFGFDVFKEAVQTDNEKKNITISPLSISTALAMTWNGAVETTYEDMAEVLKYTGIATEDINAGFLKLSDDLMPTSEMVILEQANGLFWDDNRLTAYEDFLSAVEDAFDSERMLLDFDQVEASKEAINGWVE